MTNTFNISNNVNVSIQSTSNNVSSGPPNLAGAMSQSLFMDSDQTADPEPVEAPRKIIKPATRHKVAGLDAMSPDVMRRFGPQGEPSPTVCFESPHLYKPRCHRLICGHDIITAGFEECGANCKTSANFDAKPTGLKFACPKCIGKDPFRSRGRKPDGRPCKLTHVDGLDAKKDAYVKQQRDAAFAANNAPKAATKRAADPKRKAKNQELVDDYTMNRLADAMALDDPEVLAQKRKKARREYLANDPHFGDHDIDPDDPIHKQTKWEEEFAPELAIAADADEDPMQEERAKAGLGDDLFGEDYPDDEPIYADDGTKIKPEPTDDSARTQTYCACNEPKDRNMMECQNCRQWFHPGCVNKGTKPSNVYAKPSFGRFRAWEEDRQWYRDTKDDHFVCEDCDVEAFSKGLFSEGPLAKLQSQTRQASEARKQDEAEYDPKAAVKKRIADEKAAKQAKRERAMAKVNKNLHIDMTETAVDHIRKLPPGGRRAKLDAEKTARLVGMVLDERTGDLIPEAEVAYWEKLCDHPKCPAPKLTGDHWSCTKCDEPGKDYCKPCFKKIRTSHCRHAKAAYKMVGGPSPKKK